MSDLFFNAPWWLTAGLFFAGAFIFAQGNKRQHGQTRAAGIALAAIAIGLGALSHFVDTDMDKVLKRTNQMVQSVADRDWPTLAGLLDPKTSYAIYNNRDELVKGAQANVDRFGLKSASVISQSAVQTDTVITVDLTILSMQDITMGRPIRSNWQFKWQETSTGWLLYRIESLGIENISGDEVTKRLVRK